MEPALEAGGTLELPDSESHHVFKVLRGRKRDHVEVVDGAGRLFLAALRGGREADVLEELATVGVEDSEVSLYSPCPRGGGWDSAFRRPRGVGS